MPARLAYGFLYATLVGNLDEERRLAVDAALGDPAAIAERDERRRAAVLEADFEVG